MTTGSQLFDLIFTGWLMNKNIVSFSSQYLSSARVLLFACLLPTAVFAGTPQVTQQYDHSGDRLVSPPVETTTVAASLDPGINGVVDVSVDTHDKDDAVTFQDRKTRSMPLISVAFASSDRGLGFRQDSGAVDSVQGAAAGAMGGQTATSEQNDALRIPYSLVLALFALIGLVPVSRRNR